MMDDKDFEILKLKLALSQTTILLHQSLVASLHPLVQQEQTARNESAAAKIAQSVQEGSHGIVGH